jgi:PAS domain S-box-containing protein
MFNEGNQSTSLNSLVENLQVSETRYRRLFEASRDGILILDAASRKITDANPYMCELLGYSHAEFIGKELWEIGLLKDAEASLDAFRELQETGYVRYEDLPLETRGGQRREVEIVSNVYTEGHRQVAQYNIRDITARKQAERETNLSELAKRRLAERQAAILNALPAHICLLDGNGTVLDVNIKWKEFALKNNYKGSGWGVGSNYLAICDSVTGHEAETAKQAAEGIRMVINGQSKRFEMDYPCHSPTEQRWFRLRVVPIYNEPSEDVVVMHVDITESVVTKNALRDMTLELEAAIYAYRQVLHKSLDVICTVDGAGRFVQVSAASKEIWGYEPDELVGKMYIDFVHPEDLDKTILAATDIMSGISTSDFDNRYVRKDGTVADIMWSANWSEPDQVMFCVARDVSQIRQAERALERSAEQLRQAQKLESVGRLAGGIAHDFNNMLTAINGYSDLTLRRLPDNDPVRHHIQEIKKAGQRSATLTQQLLAFSRRQNLQPVVLDLNEAILDTTKMLHRLIGEDVQLVTALDPNAGRVKVDPGQLTQIIMNLAVNARDAMLQGGKLTLETANILLDSDYSRTHLDALPGAYVMLAVSDTGTGINPETQPHIFEPFFTTKEVGKGTGLGLATVYGIVKQSGGNIMLYSEVGIGTTFKIYLPRVAEDVITVEHRPVTGELHIGTETILLVEDEDIVRSLTRQILEMCGYTVLEAHNGAEALATCETHAGKIDLLITDVVMPKIGGRELAETFALTHPQMRVLFISGYTDDAIVRHGVIEAGTNFLQKPYTPATLAYKVREVLEAPSLK